MKDLNDTIFSVRRIIEFPGKSFDFSEIVFYHLRKTPAQQKIAPDLFTYQNVKFSENAQYLGLAPKN